MKAEKKITAKRKEGKGNRTTKNVTMKKEKKKDETK